VLLGQSFISFSQKCLYFDGIDDYVRVVDNNALDLSTTGTLEAWVYLEAFQNTAGIIHKGDKSDWTDEAYSLEFNSSGKNIDFYLTAAGVNQNKLTSTTTFQLNKWYHVAVSWSSTNVYLFINGNQEASMTRTITPQNSNGGLNIGSQLNESGNYRPFKGKLDEIRIWNTYRTQSDIREKMYKSLIGTETGLVLYFNFDGTGSSVQNLSDEPKVVESLTINSSGSSYTTFPSISISGGGGSSAIASVSSMKVSSASISSQGTAYAVNNILNISNGTYTSQAKLNVLTTSSGKITSISINNAGTYTTLPSNPVSVTGGSGTGAKFNLGWGINSISVTNSGSGYTSQPTVTVNPTGANISAVISDYTGLFYNGGSLGNGSSSGPIWVSSTYAPQAHAWLGTTNTSWNTASNWFGGWLPYALIPVNISNSASRHCIVSSNLECEKLTIESSRTLTVNPGFTLKAYGSTTINGQLIFDANNSNAGCFIDNGTISYGASAVVNFKRVLTNNKWHYVSSPVSNATTNVFWGGAVYTYSETDGDKGTTIAWKPAVANTALTPFKGFDVYFKNNDKTVTFAGNLNTGTYSNNSLTRQFDGYNFIGNPYPSAIDWNAESGWTKQNIDNAIYLWNPDLNNGAGNYQLYSSGGSVNGGTNVIAPTQAFWVKVSNGKSTGAVSVNNNARVASNVAYRNTNNNIKISVSTEGFTDETVISFNQDATEKFDNQFDANKFFVLSGSGSMIYTKSFTDELAINCMPDLNGHKSITLYSRVLADNDMTLSFSGLENIGPNYNILLEDTKTATITDLRMGNYQYYAQLNDNEARFIIHFVPVQVISSESNYQNTTSTNEFTNANTLVYSYQNSVYVNLSNVDLTNENIISVYNLQGKKLAD